MSHLALFGIANERSLAWSCLKTLYQDYEHIHLGVLDERTKKKVSELLEQESWHQKKVSLHLCDVQEEDQMKAFFDAIPTGSLSGLVHSLAFTDRSCLTQPFSQVTKEQFSLTLTISCYSFIQMMQLAKPKFQKPASAVCLSYIGSTRIVPNYNIMGVAKAALESSARYLSAEFGTQQVRVNTISAGPVRTLASSAIKDFRQMLDVTAQASPLGRNITGEDVAQTMRFLLRPESSGLTGSTLFVDGGFQETVGLPLKTKEP